MDFLSMGVKFKQTILNNFLQNFFKVVPLSKWASGCEKNLLKLDVWLKKDES